MKKVISWILFVFIVLLFVFDIYVTVSGTIECKRQVDEIEARGGGGHEYLGVGTNVLIMAVGLMSVLGMILSFLSCALAQNRIVRIVSLALFLLFIPTPILCFFSIYL